MWLHSMKLRAMFQLFTASYLNNTFIPAGSGLGAVLLREGSLAGPISDILEFSYTATFFFIDVRIQFTSDEEGGPALTFNGDHVDRIEECDCLIDYTAALSGLDTNIGPVIHDHNIQIQAQSDCDSPCAVVPEVATLDSVSPGVLGMLACCLLRRRSRVAAEV